jgi:hypothetical protein
MVCPLSIHPDYNDCRKLRGAPYLSLCPTERAKKALSSGRSPSLTEHDETNHMHILDPSPIVTSRACLKSWLNAVLVICISISGCQEPGAATGTGNVAPGDTESVAIARLHLDLAEPDGFAASAFPTAYQSAAERDDATSVFDTIEEARVVELVGPRADGTTPLPVIMIVFNADPLVVGGLSSPFTSKWTISLHVEPSTPDQAKDYVLSLCKLAGFDADKVATRFEHMASDGRPVGLVVQGNIGRTYLAVEAFDSFGPEQEVRLIVSVAATE